MHTEEDGQPGSAELPRGRKPSLLMIVLILAVIAAIIASSFALAHALIGGLFHRLGG
ncbi:hypothetical protein GZH47_12505 [Paenibacillus rhizovicinus]|uniref:Uncharacterized protein n=1 Tax=Paenibacillus rhizovicinus TaxID=2704463 RepID=A0A6C0NZF6_9BACL|nr:hypothetical protein [Paenibacillus rhizovicinus]QHW31579.1 hypothetical protein GZH47_12505 [Paenibacillus rhizovicinus]